MAVTRSWTATTPLVIGDRRAARPRMRLAWLLAASLFVAAGLAAVYTAKVTRLSGQPLNLNTVTSPAELLPVLEAFPDRAELAPRIWDYLARTGRIRNAGALTAVMPRRQVARLKPLVAVRTLREFQTELLRSAALFFAGFYLVALLWRVTGFHGDRALIPAIQLLSGIGFVLMLSLRDPLRDTLEFQKFAVGVFLGCLLLALPAFRWFDYRRLSDWCYTPLFAALGLFTALMIFGKGPAGNDAKVNLGPFQPVELIKILIVLFLAGYFTRKWERLRDLRRTRDMLPVACATGIAIVLFFVLKDLGPALVTFFVFLACFTTARGRPWLAMAGILALVSAVAVGYRVGQPHTVVQRIDMWLSPWDNQVRGGDQLAHGLWAFATGGPTGSGPGWGDPSLIPAGNTDLVLPAIGEEAGFAGVAVVCLLFAFLVARGLRAAARAETTYGFFLAVGLASLIAVEMLLITSGVLGALPLSGVVSPFLSSGNTGMLANFAVFALIASVTAGTQEVALPRPSARPLKWALAVAAVVLLGFAARFQVFQDSVYLARDSHAVEEDNVQRPQHNPRMNSLAREIPRGAIYDRNGIPLATSDWRELDRHRADYAALGVSLDTAVNRFDTRHYPFGAATAHLTGDLRTGENFHATNASLVEHDSNRQLQGYEYAELAPLIRYRHHPGNAGVARILARDRSVHLTVDARLQLRARDILAKHLQSAGQLHGALVVMDPDTGDVLALVSAPAPTRDATPEELLDRARYGQYPPGSTFKLVTAIAALRGDSALTHRTYLCRTLSDGRCGNRIAGWNRDIKDDIGDHAHGTLDMQRAITVSCNAYFAQLGVHDVGAKALAATAELLGIPTGDPVELRHALPFAAYGQGPVLISPFKMARVAATIAAGGRMPQGRWIADESNPRADAALEVLAPPQAAFLAAAMRRVVTEGTARHVMAGALVPIAGKTGTAQLDQGMPHAWFTGFAPFGPLSPAPVAAAISAARRVANPLPSSTARARPHRLRRRRRTRRVRRPRRRPHRPRNRRSRKGARSDMTFTEFLEKWGKTVFESPLGAAPQHASPPEFAEIRLAALEEVRRKSYRAGARKVFPFDLIHVSLRGVEESRADLFAGAFFRKYLEQEVHTALRADGCRFPENLRIEVEVATGLPQRNEPWLVVEASSRERGPGVAANVARLVVNSGSANVTELRLTKARTHIGREVNVYRNQGLHRRNDLAFVEDTDINRSVSREHAHIRHDRATGEYRLFNDRWYQRGAECGTWIVRDGLSREVHRDNRGTRLEPGDEIHFGRAVVVFELP